MTSFCDPCGYDTMNQLYRAVGMQKAGICQLNAAVDCLSTSFCLLDDALADLENCFNICGPVYDSCGPCYDPCGPMYGGGKTVVYNDRDCIPEAPVTYVDSDTLWGGCYDPCYNRGWNNCWGC